MTALVRAKVIAAGMVLTWRNSWDAQYFPTCTHECMPFMQIYEVIGQISGNPPLGDM